MKKSRYTDSKILSILKQNKRGKIVHRIDIDKRSELANTSSHLGGFEGNTIVGNKHKTYCLP